jgi:hypothetical protein
MKARVAVCVPSGGSWEVKFGASLFDMLLHVGQHPMPGIEEFGIGLSTSQGSILPQERQRLVLAAQQVEATHLLWLDDDMVFPPDTLHRLMAHRQPIVAANCTTRTVPTRPCAAKGGQRVKSNGRTGLEEVDHVGMAVMLTEMAVFEKIRQPWFMFGFSPKAGAYTGEDVFFCHNARQHGFTVYIDHDLSTEIGHMGSHEFHHGMVE